MVQIVQKLHIIWLTSIFKPEFLRNHRFDFLREILNWKFTFVDEDPLEKFLTLWSVGQNGDL